MIQGIWPEELIDAAARAAAALAEDENPGGFPCRPAMQLFNDVALHPRLLRAAAQLLGTDDLRLVQGFIYS